MIQACYTKGQKISYVQNLSERIIQNEDDNCVANAFCLLKYAFL